MKTQSYHEIAAKCYGGDNADPMLLNGNLSEWLDAIAAKVRLAHDERQEADLRSSQVIALACQMWEFLNPNEKPYGD